MLGNGLGFAHQHNEHSGGNTCKRKKLLTRRTTMLLCIALVGLVVVADRYFDELYDFLDNLFGGK
jgi:hypothetical protein